MIPSMGRKLNILKVLFSLILLTHSVVDAGCPFGFAAEQKPAASPLCPVPPKDCSSAKQLKYRSYDGSCNNLNNPTAGITPVAYDRLLPPTTYPVETFANVRTLSLDLYGNKSLLDKTNSIATMQFAQFLAHDLSQVLLPQGLNCCNATIASSNPACFAIHTDDPSEPSRCMNFQHAITNTQLGCSTTCDKGYPEKMSGATPHIDLSTVYGTSSAKNLAIRTMQGGLLTTSNVGGINFAPINEPCGNITCASWGMADFRDGPIPTLAAVHTAFIQEHNRIATALSKINPQWDDDTLFEEARRIVIAEYQKFVFNDYAPTILGKQFCLDNGITYNTRGFVDDYDVNELPQILGEFAVMAFRHLHLSILGHFDLVTPDLKVVDTRYYRDNVASPISVGLLTKPDGFSEIVRGLVTSQTKKVDHNLDIDMKEFLFRLPGQKGGDLTAMDLQRARDFLFRSYNDMRELAGLPRAVNWADFEDTIDRADIESIKRFYDSPQLVEARIGGDFERHMPDSKHGPTLANIMVKQLQNSRWSDRFFFERPYQPNSFTQAQLTEIKKASLSGLLCANTGIGQIQPNAFLVPSKSNKMTNCKYIPQMDLTKWRQ